MNKQRTVLVTGAARGIGLAIALKLVESGYHVVLVDRDGSALTAAAQALPAERVLALTADITDKDAPEALDRAIRERWDPVSILINNAGVPSPKRNRRAAGILELTEKEWHSVLDVNLTAVFRMSQKFLPFMYEQHWGRVVNIASLAGRGRSFIAGPSYVAAKAGVIGLTRAIAAEFGPHGITANSIAPGLIDTSMTAARSPESNANLVTQIPVGRMGRPDEIAAAASFLIGEDVGFINGAVIDVNGGVWMA